MCVDVVGPFCNRSSSSLGVATTLETGLVYSQIAIQRADAVWLYTRQAVHIVYMVHNVVYIDTKVCVHIIVYSALEPGPACGARPCLRGPARERRRSNLLITTGRAECLTGRAGPDILGPPRPAQDTLC